MLYLHFKNKILFSRESLRIVFSWKLSRTKELSDAANQEINNVISDIPVLDQQYYTIRDQSPEGCFYYPEPEPGVTVVFPGQCDTTIPVVEDFNLASVSIVNN